MEITNTSLLALNKKLESRILELENLNNLNRFSSQTTWTESPTSIDTLLIKTHKLIQISKQALDSNVSNQTSTQSQKMVYE